MAGWADITVDATSFHTEQENTIPGTTGKGRFAAPPRAGQEGDAEEDGGETEAREPARRVTPCNGGDVGRFRAVP